MYAIRGPVIVVVNFNFQESAQYLLQAAFNDIALIYRGHPRRGVIVDVHDV